MDLKIQDGYLLIEVRSESVRQTLIKSVNATQDDMIIYIWGEDKIRDLLSLAEVTTKQRLQIRNGQTIGKYLPFSKVEEFVIERRDFRLKRDDVIARIDKVLKALNRFFLKELRRLKKAREFIKLQDSINPAIIHCMDGSALLWLNAILAAKKDFLRWHYDPHKEEIEDYVSARLFLLDDTYHVLMDGPESLEAGTAKYVNLRDILGLCMEQCKRMDLGPLWAVEPSVEQLRASLARASGDPKLIALLCKDFSGITSVEPDIEDQDDEDLDE